MSEWISVQDKLPEEDSLILAYMEGFGGVKRVDVIRFDPRYSTVSRTVTHWMPLPKPPKED